MRTNENWWAPAPAVVLTVLLGNVGAASLWNQAVYAAQASETALREQADALLKNAEEMVAHGGMGDAKAIIHHCGEASRHAEFLLTHIPSSDPHPNQASASLNEVIAQCKRVSEIGPHADPGLLLNPAIKARRAAQESVKALGLQRKG